MMDPVSPGRFASRLTAMTLAALLLAGCASVPENGSSGVSAIDQTNDPLEPANRAVFAFNQVVDKAVLKPVAQGYRAAVPQFGRDRVSDFLTNLKSPIVLANDLLQAEFERAGITISRFLLNSTFGVLGIMDVAGPMGLPGHSEDFGQTFAVWGVGEGPYLVLPLLGPSNPRDAAGLAAEWYLDPVNIYFDNESIDWAQWTRTGVTVVDARERGLDVLDEIERSSLDFYSALRSLYRQRREADIRNSNGSAAKPGNGISFDFEAEMNSDSMDQKK